MAAKVTEALGGSGIWGIEFFITLKGVVFSELSPRPHDTGMVTLANTQNLNEFELHARALLGLPIPAIELQQAGVSAVILAQDAGEQAPTYSGVETALAKPHSDVKLFGKPNTRPYRRMGVALTYGSLEGDMETLRAHAKAIADCVMVESH